MNSFNIIHHFDQNIIDQNKNNCKEFILDKNSLLNNFIIDYYKNYIYIDTTINFHYYKNNYVVLKKINNNYQISQSHELITELYQKYNIFYPISKKYDYDTYFSYYNILTIKKYFKTPIYKIFVGFIDKDSDQLKPTRIFMVLFKNYLIMYFHNLNITKIEGRLYF
jgi:hypothetical protein